MATLERIIKWEMETGKKWNQWMIGCRRNSNPIGRFWKGVDKKGEDDCWNWIKSKSAGGYGKFQGDHKRSTAHRFSWELHFGEIPKGMFVCHRCDNPSCVNPKHLFLGSPMENVMDMLSKGRQTRRGVKGWSINELQVRSIRRAFEFGVKQGILSKMFDISPAHIHNIVRGKTRNRHAI